MGPVGRESKAVFLRGCDINETEGIYFSTFEDRRNSTASACAYPTPESRGPGACVRAMNMAIDCFMERPAVTDIAMEMITKMMDDDVRTMQDSDKAFLCSYAGVYIFKGKARAHVLGYSAAMFYELEELKGSWLGNKVPVGAAARSELKFAEPFELTEDSRIILISAGEAGIAEEAVSFIRENGAEDTESFSDHFKERHCSYVNLYLPKRERRGFLR